MWAGLPEAVGVGGHVDAPSGKVSLHVRIQAAPWIDVSNLRIWRGGSLVREFAVASSQQRIRFDQTFDADVPLNTWFVAEATGRQSMWPVITPYEVPPVLVSDAVGAIADSAPSLIQEVTPYAITNPIWVDKTPSRSSPLMAGRPPVVDLPPGPPRRTADLWRIIGALHGE
jgi:hypothetical protein